NWRARSLAEVKQPLLPPKPAEKSTKYGLAALKGELEKLAQSRNGTRNDQLNRSAFNLGQLIAIGHLIEADVINALRECGFRVGLNEAETETTIRSGLTEGKKKPRKQQGVRHDEVLNKALEKLSPYEWSKLESQTQRAYYVITVDKVLRALRAIGCGLCKHNEAIYEFNGQHWKELDRDLLMDFLAMAAEKLDVPLLTAKDFSFREKLFKQFLAMAYLPKPKRSEGVTLINLSNGTFEVTATNQTLREFRHDDFLTYQLPFAYDPNARCLKW